MLKLFKFCLKTYKLQNTAIKVITIKRLLHQRNSRREVSLRFTIPRNLRTIHRKNIYKEVPPDKTANKVIYSVVQITPTLQKHFCESPKIFKTVIAKNTSSK